jgi:hypothetical protein
MNHTKNTFIEAKLQPLDVGKERTAVTASPFNSRSQSIPIGRLPLKNNH